ncbi:MAG: protein NO VEIN domain-containing protein, partial [Gemmatimonas sp.]
KAMKGSLEDRPVGLSSVQFEFARQHGDQYWLYIVEHAGDAARSRIVKIKDPAGRAGTFTFDKGWISIAHLEGPLQATSVASTASAEESIAR